MDGSANDSERPIRYEVIDDHPALGLKRGQRFNSVTEVPQNVAVRVVKT